MNNLDPFAEDAVIIEATPGALSRPVFSELSVFGNLDNKAAAVVDFLGETYSFTESYVIAYGWRELFERVLDQTKAKAISGTNAKSEEIRVGGRVVATLTEKNLPAKWDYTADATWTELNTKLAEIKDQIKAHEKTLQTIKSEMVDPATGEVMTPATKRESGTTIAVKLAEVL